MTCQRCGGSRTPGSRSRYCRDCMKDFAAIYLASPLPVRVLARKLGISDVTLKLSAQEEFGTSRSDLTDEERSYLLNQINREGVDGDYRGATTERAAQTGGLR